MDAMLLFVLIPWLKEDQEGTRTDNIVEAVLGDVRPFQIINKEGKQIRESEKKKESYAKASPEPETPIRIGSTPLPYKNLAKSLLFKQKRASEDNLEDDDCPTYVTNSIEKYEKKYLPPALAATTDIGFDIVDQSRDILVAESQQSTQGNKYDADCYCSDDEERMEWSKAMGRHYPIKPFSFGSKTVMLDVNRLERMFSYFEFDVAEDKKNSRIISRSAGRVHCDMDLEMVDPWCVGYNGEEDALIRRLVR
ncbi:hypothetical protein SUGI_0197720 [Cryptomeria japonica]|nr:hypothetical protein SUGI_0197720 [Cryptomeria japonica]